MAFAALALRTTRRAILPRFVRCLSSGPVVDDTKEATIYGYHGKPQTSGGKTGEFPSNWDQATGREWEELVAEAANEDRYELTSLVGPFGTMQNPTVVLSAFNSRIVGCVGGSGRPHQLLWFSLKSGKKHICRECGQVFVLDGADNDSAEQEHAEAH